MSPDRYKNAMQMLTIGWVGIFLSILLTLLTT